MKYLFLLLFPMMSMGSINTSIHELGRDIQSDMQQEWLFRKLIKKRLTKYVDKHYGQYLEKIQEGPRSPADTINDTI